MAKKLIQKILTYEEARQYFEINSADKIELREEAKKHKSIEDFMKATLHHLDEIEGIDAIIQGIKPVVLTSPETASKKITNKELNITNFSVKKSDGETINYAFVWKKDETLRVEIDEAAMMVSNMVKNRVKSSDEYDRKLGNLLGYSKKAIENFIAGKPTKIIPKSQLIEIWNEAKKTS